MLPQSLWL